MRAIVLHGEELRLEERPDPVPGSNELVVAQPYAAVNPADLAQRAGRYPAPPGAPQDVPGMEVCGAVVALGDAVLGWQVGDRVFGLVGGGGLADRVAVHERHVVRMPERLDDREAAAVPEAFLTAHDAIVTQAGLGAGDVLLVNGANGGVGIAAVQVGRLVGARVIASARSEEARGRLAELGAEAVAPDDAHEGVREAGGADVILELVGAPNDSEHSGIDRRRRSEHAARQPACDRELEPGAPVRAELRAWPYGCALARESPVEDHVCTLQRH